MLLPQLAEQKAELISLYDVLEQELDAIVKRDHDTLLEVVTQKNTLLASISKRDQALSPYLADHSDDNQAVIDEINQLLEQCKQQNDVNHVAANQSQLASQKLREILFGKTASSYDKTGKAYSLPNQLAKNIKA
jgi:flagella synthesis protein FlgN